MQEEAICIFYSNVFGENFLTQSFFSLVYKVPIIVNPNVIVELLRVPWVTEKALEFTIGKLTKAHKSEWVKELCGKFAK